MTGATDMTKAAQPDSPGVVRSSDGLGANTTRQRLMYAAMMYGSASESVDMRTARALLIKEMDALVREEKERCAKLCDSTVALLLAGGYQQSAASVATIADDIRA